MTREHKLALILGFSVVLVVGVLISDHFSDATGAQLEDLTAETNAASALPVPPTRNDSQPIEQTHATVAPRGSALPGGFSIDGEEQTETPITVADRSVFRSGGEALLNELQQAWSRTQTMKPVPAAELDTVPTELGVQAGSSMPEPTIVAKSSSPRAGQPERGVPVKTHRVSEEESLWSIAQQHYGDGALYTKLASFNRDRIGEDNLVRVGVVLAIPPKHTLTGERRAPRKKASRPAMTASRTYTVREGDTLGEIAQRLLGSSKRWTEIVKLNSIEDPDVVPVGTMLMLPVASR